MSTTAIDTKGDVATPVSAERIQDWIVAYLARVLNVEGATIAVDAELERLGLNSALVVSMMGDLEDWLGLELPPAVMFDYPTIRTLSAHLATMKGA